MTSESRHRLGSGTCPRLIVPRTRLSTIGDRSFRVTVAQAWNSDETRMSAGSEFQTTALEMAKSLAHLQTVHLHSVTLVKVLIGLLLNDNKLYKLQTADCDSCHWQPERLPPSQVLHDWLNLKAGQVMGQSTNTGRIKRTKKKFASWIRDER